MNRVLGRWQVETVRGSVQSIHHCPPPTEPVPRVVVNQVIDTVLVLGSTQSADVVDRDAVEAAGIEVIRRRSGGGVVLVGAGWQVWIDIWIPAGDRLWSNDVVKAAFPIGDAWACALAATEQSLAPNNSLIVHRGGVSTEADRLGRLVCFAGRGPGEVFAPNGSKLVGISQRRTRDWIRVQSMAYRRWNAAATLSLLSFTDAERATANDRLARFVMGIGDCDVTDRVVLALP